MTTTATHAFVTAIASGTAPIPFDFQAQSMEEVGVLLNTVPLEYITDYTVGLNGDGTGFVNPINDWGTGDVLVYSKPSFQQPFDFLRFGPFYPDQFVPPIDRVARSVIALAEDARRAIKGPFGSEGLFYDNTPNTFFGTDDTGTPAQLSAADLQGPPGEQGPPGDLGTLKVKTPYMFGAQGMDIKSDPGAIIIDVASLDASPDDSDALIAMFLDAEAPENANYVYDFRGHWKITKPLKFLRPLYNVGDLNVEYHGRNFIGGHFHVGPVAEQPGGVPMDDVITISSPYCNLLGHWYIHSGDRGTTSYATRRFKRGMRFIQCQHSYVEQISVFSAKREAVWIDSQYENWGDVVGPHGSISKNNIGLRIGGIVANHCGSSFQGGDAMCVELTITGRDHGGSATAGSFDTNEAAWTGNQQQITKLTVASTAEIMAGDYGRTRQEILPATYTSIAANTGASTITWTAGDPVAAGLGVGQVIYLVDDGNVGVNENIPYRIVGFSGTSNRVIQVYPSPTTETARVYSQINTLWEVHRVTEVYDATHFGVTPWVPDQNNSKWYHISGGVLASGNDGAAVQIGYLGALVCGIGLNSTALYSPHVANVVFDFVDIGLAHGINAATPCFGPTLNHSHFEGTQWDIVQNVTNISLARLEVHANSSFNGGVIGLTARATTTSPLTLNQDFYGNITYGNVSIQPHLFANTVLGITSSNFSLSNSPGNNSARVTAANPIITLSWIETIARMGLAAAEVLWCSAAGVGPTGTLTVALDAEMAGNGWAIVGVTSLPNPSGPVMLKFTFYAPTKKVFVHRFDTSGGVFVGYPIDQNNGGTVTQATSKITGVTLNKRTGKIVTHNQSMAAGATYNFIFTNDQLDERDNLILTKGQGGTVLGYDIRVGSIVNGSAQIVIENVSGGALAEAIDINFAIVKGSWN